MNRPAIVVMGVAGCGKSTLARALADRLGALFIEGDDCHPPENIARMSVGIALSDADRQPFLASVAAAVRAVNGGGVVASCSALKRSYRDILRAEAGRALWFVLPDLTRGELATRLAARRDHFMPAALLDSQLAVLEPPQPDEASVLVPGMWALTEQVEFVLLTIAIGADRTRFEA